MTEKYYTKREASAYLRSLGLPVAENSLSKYITIGNGPLFNKFGRRVVYKQENLDNWAQSRLSGSHKASCEIKEVK